jgi:hypothetical protein
MLSRNRRSHGGNEMADHDLDHSSLGFQQDPFVVHQRVEGVLVDIALRPSLGVIQGRLLLHNTQSRVQTSLRPSAHCANA